MISGSQMIAIRPKQVTLLKKLKLMLKNKFRFIKWPEWNLVYGGYLLLDVEF